MTQITHYILGCPTNEPHSNGHTPWNYFKTSGEIYNGRTLVTDTRETPELAQKYFFLSHAMRRRQFLWGSGWEVIAEPIHEVIDHKLYAENHQKS